MAWINENAKFKAWIKGTNDETCVKRSLPYRSEVTELEKLKSMVKDWTVYTVHLAIFYDLQRTDHKGQPLEIGRFQNNIFHGI